jgi:acyl-CoA synthetase (AMP-forming)/AMP-acid ligase II
MRNPQIDELCQNRYNELLPHLFDYVDKWAAERPDDIAIIEYDTGDQVSWNEFATKTKAYAKKLLGMGIKKGDVVATTLILLKEHIFLLYACYRIGAIVSPLDVRLKVAEVDACFEQAMPKAYFFQSRSQVADFRPMVEEIKAKYGEACTHWIQIQDEEEGIIDGAQWAKEWEAAEPVGDITDDELSQAQEQVEKRDPCLIIFTTGSTGRPKPALLCHEGILVQNIGLATGFGYDWEGKRTLLDLPPSHVGCVTEFLGTSVYQHSTMVIMSMFDPAKCLGAVQKYKVNMLGQIPALYAMEWRVPGYAEYDLSSLEIAIYGGQTVTRDFLEKLAAMAPYFASGLGLTETSGFVTYTPLDITVDDLAASIGFDLPFYPISIRDVIQEDGTAGPEKEPGEIGEICFTGPQSFLGYLNNEEITRKTLSTDGWLYTGDLGSYDETGLHFAGRSKFVIKPKGYQVYPPEVEEFFSQRLKGRVGSIAIVGTPHEVFIEGVMAFVEKATVDTELTEEELEEVAKDMAAYKRPSHYEILEPGAIPLNRVAKTDYAALKERAKEIAETLRAEGKWDVN